MAATFLLEQQVAIAAVRRACSLTTAVFNKLVVGETLVKGDKSPVTGARDLQHTNPMGLVEMRPQLSTFPLSQWPTLPHRR